MSQLRNTFLNVIVGKREQPSLPEESNGEKKRKRRGDKLQLVQEVRMMPVEGMRAIDRAF